MSYRPSAAELAWMRQEQANYNDDSFDIYRNPERDEAGRVGEKALHLEGVMFQIFPRSGNGRQQRAFEPLAGAKTTNFATTAHGTDVLPGDELRQEGRWFAVDGVDTTLDTAVLLALSEAY